MKRKALFIGVNEYKDPAIRNLSCSVRDAISMHDIFEELGYQTNLLENPGSGDVFHAVREMTCDMAAGDQFLFYFAGHGFTDGGQHLLFCADDIHEHLRFHRAGIPFDLLEMETRKGGYGRAFLLDACQSDFLTGTRGEDATTRDLVAIGDMVPKAEDATGAFYVLRSCSKYEHALEIESRRHGLFTLAMIDILRQSKNAGTELLFNDTLRETIRESMCRIASAEGMTAKQTPESDGRGKVLVLMSGVKIPPQHQVSNSPVMVECPICGKHNRVEETFKCKVCGKNHLCMSHFSSERNCCMDCANAIQLKANTQKAIEAYNGNDYARAFSLAQKADQSIAVIQYIIGYGLENGFGCEKNQVEAIKWYRKAAKQDDVKAQYELGRSLAVLFDDRLRKKEELEGVDWLRKAAGSGHAEAQYYLGYYLLWYFDTRDAPKELQPEGIGWLQKASENGHVKAQNLLAYSYRSGDGAERNYELAVKWYRAAAEQGHAESQYDLGRCYEQGLGVAANLNEALHWYFRAANQGNKEAQYKVGWCRYYGKGYPPDYSEAVTWFRKAAEQGHSCAQFYLGWCYYKGDGIAQDLEEAIKWYRKAAEQGDIDACYNLGYCYDNGEGVERDCVESVKWYRKAADFGYALAQGNLGWMYINGEGVEQNDDEALAWFRKAAEQGNDNAQYSVGWMYENGRGVTKSDVEAVKWYVKAAEQGHAEALSNITSLAQQGCVEAQYNLALLYLNGKGVDKNNAEALKWFLKAAEQKNVDAQLWAGVIYGNGNGVHQNYEEAVKWYRAAADQGNAMSQFNLGVMYANGLGVKGDLSVAAEWYRRAAAQGHEKAKEALKKIESVLKNDAIFKGVMRDFLKKTDGGVKNAASGEDAETSDLKTGTVKTLVLPGGAKMEMIYVAPGSFMMGSPTNEFGRDDDEAQHQVVLTNGYWLGKYPVTQKQWVSVMGDNPSRHQGKDEFPVDYVSWEDCHKFITKINAIMGCEARMPTEAEWEYACRAGTSSSYGGTGKLDEMGWYDGNRIKSLPVGEWSHIVGQKKPNGYGLYDMHGNMAEWCADWYGDYPTGKVINPTGPASGRYRVLRGGSWRQDDLYCRSAGRSYGSPDFRDNIFGFRLCCSAGTHFMDSREVKCDSNCQSGRQISNTIPFAPTGVKVVERESSWVVSSREHSSATGYNGVRFSKSKCDGDKAVVTFLHNYGTDAQKAEYAASGKPCPSDWKRKK